MKKNYLDISLLLSFISIAVTLFINIQVAQRYIRATGKTRALFGLTELLTFGYQYYIALIGIVAFILAVLSLKNDRQHNKRLMAVLLSIVAIAVVFVRIWRVFI